MFMYKKDVELCGVPPSGSGSPLFLCGASASRPFGCLRGGVVLLRFRVGCRCWLPFVPLRVVRLGAGRFCPLCCLLWRFLCLLLLTLSSLPLPLLLLALCLRLLRCRLVASLLRVSSGVVVLGRWSCPRLLLRLGCCRCSSLMARPSVVSRWRLVVLSRLRSLSLCVRLSLRVPLCSCVWRLVVRVGRLLASSVACRLRCLLRLLWLLLLGLLLASKSLWLPASFGAWGCPCGFSFRGGTTRTIPS